MVRQQIEVREDLIGALYPILDEDEDDLEEVGVEVTPVEFLGESAAGVLAGEFNDAGVVGCAQ